LRTNTRVQKPKASIWMDPELEIWVSVLGNDSMQPWSCPVNKKKEQEKTKLWIA